MSPPIARRPGGEGCAWVLVRDGRRPTPSQEGLTTQSCQARPFFSSFKGCGKPDFSPGGSGSCAFVQTGNGAGSLMMNRACQSFIVDLATVGFVFNHGHCMVQYSTVNAAHSGGKKIVVETRLIAVGCLLLWVSF